MSDTPETDAAELIYDGIVASGYADVDVCRKLERERDDAREALADIALMDTSGLAAPAVNRALRSLGQWKDILDAKTTQDLRQSMEAAK